jgi:ribosome-associated translation inhibitor RaiA
MALDQLDVTAPDLPPERLEEVRSRVFGTLERFKEHGPESIRLTLRRTDAAKRPWVADANALFEGRVIAAHAAGRDANEATEAVLERLRRQLLRITKSEVALRNEFDLRHRPESSRKPPELRRIVHRRTYADRPLPTLSAVADLLQLDLEFHLFVHVRTNEDVVVHHRDDGRIGLLFPRGSVLADENDVVVPEPSRYSEPLAFDAARSEMDVANHRWMYFVDAADLRGKVLYLRHDADYGVVEPE